ncbi:uncharacterized protein LOC127754377 [Oryza glaberrima]|uniref:uncharacterized protein LOC127754377 n=1 Tax=Oryza glaberrima TaxID=4538 RepID=UPI00224C20AD|nr:uncharacterized protein LOC127754377 [Oryza glaberrima]
MSSSAMEAMDELVQLAESMCQAASLLLGDDDPSDESSPRRPSTFLNAVALGNVQVGSALAAAARVLLAVDVVSSLTAAVASVQGASKSAVPRRVLLAVDVVFSLTAAVASAVRVASCSHRIVRHRRGRRQAQIRGEPLQWAAAAASVGFRPGGRG